MLVLFLLHPRSADIQKRAWLEGFKQNFDARSTEPIRLCFVEGKESNKTVVDL